MTESTGNRFRSEAGPSRDALTDVIRHGARRLLAEALNAEVESFLTEFQESWVEGLPPRKSPWSVASWGN